MNTPYLRHHHIVALLHCGLREEAVAEIPQVVLAQRLFGDPDYLMHVVTRDLPAFQKLYDDKLSAMPGVQHLRSTLVMKTVVQDRPFPLETLNASR